MGSLPAGPDLQKMIRTAGRRDDDHPLVVISFLEMMDINGGWVYIILRITICRVFFNKYVIDVLVMYCKLSTLLHSIFSLFSR